MEQEGYIKVFPNSSSVTSAKIFLDLSNIVSSGSERGILGLTFHPDYENNGYLFVNYTVANPNRSRISKFSVSSINPDSADENSEVNLITFNQPYTSHNSGWMSFGTNDGYLYIASGDGGSVGDPDDNSQDVTTFLGNILRIDVDNQANGKQYAIPADNPFVDSTGNELKEIFAWGLRNPWRNSFDPNTGWLWNADVGQSNQEEVNIIEKGKNYGWRCREGTEEYNTYGCDYPEYVDPIWQYDHNQGCSVTGGHVYRGQNVPELIGKYIYGDYCQQTVWMLEYDGISPATNQTLLTAPGRIVSFGVDQENELYALTFNPYNIYIFAKVLPVELVSFSGQYRNNEVILNWKTATEVNNYGFEVQRQAGNRELTVGKWKVVDFVEGSGNSSSPKFYSYIDTEIRNSSVYHYRLKQVDTDGSFTYSNEILVTAEPPNYFSLSQNYPNPFNPKTKIYYSIPGESLIEIKLYDVLGTEIATLVNGIKPTGRYELIFDASNISSGIYYYRMQSGSYFDIKKMVILK